MPIWFFRNKETLEIFNPCANEAIITKQFNDWKALFQEDEDFNYELVMYMPNHAGYYREVEKDNAG